MFLNSFDSLPTLNSLLFAFSAKLTSYCRLRFIEVLRLIKTASTVNVYCHLCYFELRLTYLILLISIY